MNDIRILIPWDELSDEAIKSLYWQAPGGHGMYVAIEERYTRHITPEDIRSCLRMPDDWTQEQRNEFMNVVADRLCGAQDVAIKFLDIATRPAPEEHKPCPACREKVICCHTFKDLSRHVLVCPLCGLATGEYYSEDDAWASWDRRATDE